MAMNVNTNLGSINNQLQLSKTQVALRKAFAELSSGKRVNSAADDAAGLAISQQLISQFRGDNRAITNASDGIGLVQTADDALGQLQNNTQRIRELAVQSANGTLTDNDRQQLQQEVDQLTQANSAIVQNTSFNGTSAFTGGTQVTLQIGANNSPNAQLTIGTPDLTATPANGGLNTFNASLTATGVIDISSQSAAQNTLTALDSDQQTLTSARGTLGATSNRLDAAISNLQVTAENTAAANSRIVDADYAASASNLIRQQILAQAGIATQAQANVAPSLALSLLR